MMAWHAAPKMCVCARRHVTTEPVPLRIIRSDAVHNAN